MKLFDDGELFVLELHGPHWTPWEWSQREELCPRPWRPQQKDGRHYFVQSSEVAFAYVCDGCGTRMLTSKDGPR